MPNPSPESINSQNLPFIEDLLEQYQGDPASVSPQWREYFQRIQPNGDGSNGRLGPSFQPSSIFNPRTGGNGHATGHVRTAARTDEINLQDRVDQMVRAYRVRGHVIAQTDPLGFPRPFQPELDPGFYGFEEGDMDRIVSSRTIFGPDTCRLREIVQRLQNTYCRSIGVQFMHIDEIGVRHWLQDRMEGTENRIKLSRREQLRILTYLTDAVIFEEFIQKKYVGAKSFSLEGAESLIPLLDLAIGRAGEQGVQEIVLSMAHRGRLNVLVNIMGKSPQEIFREFDDAYPDLHIGRGDVKYHLGYSRDWPTLSGKKIHLSLCFNPSHLEFVNPVALGRMRAKQDYHGDPRRERGMVLLIHGDAAFAGEGVTQETLNLSELEGYTTGGTIHVIVNNQIGFTTSPHEGRSCMYASGPGKMLQIPIFHVNGEDPEAVAQVVRLAMDFRRDFRRDVVIDMYCYRRYGHNEADEPAFTHPVLYRAIEKRPNVREGYLQHLLALDGLTREEADRIADRRRHHLEHELSKTRNEPYHPVCPLTRGVWSGYFGGSAENVAEAETAVDRDRLVSLLEKLATVPDDFHPHLLIKKALAARHEMARGERPLDWSTAEAMAFASLVTEGVRVRMSGQDAARGTFSQRHSVLHDHDDGHAYMPLQHLSEDQAPIEIINSSLSEVGVLGFEYGYSLDCPAGLVLWEAQFGDFCNAAQVIIDQFIASAEDKWQRLSGIVLLLPHGFEGQGPEHSSARLERFLMLAAEHNIQVVYPTTPAQYFHLLRRQVLRRWRKPLVVMTPKSLLRNPRATSSLAHLARGRFQLIIPDDQPHKEPPSRLLLCSGKIAYDLFERREKAERGDVAILRVEQLYPLSDSQLQGVLDVYPDDIPAIWVQEEPENMGAWPYLRRRFGDRLLGRWSLRVVSREESASPATGSAASHKLEQQRLVDAAFA